MRLGHWAQSIYRNNRYSLETGSVTTFHSISWVHLPKMTNIVWLKRSSRHFPPIQYERFLYSLQSEIKSPDSHSFSLLPAAVTLLHWICRKFCKNWRKSKAKMSAICNRSRVSSCLIKRLKYHIAMVSNRRSFTTSEGHRPAIVNKRSLDILHDPLYNKVYFPLLVN